jgi:hypothetical protein
MPNLTILEGSRAYLNETEQRILNNPRMTTLIGAMYYLENPNELVDAMRIAGKYYIPPPPGQVETLGFLTALAAFLAPIVSAGAITFIQTKGEALVEDRRAAAYIEQLKVMQAQEQMESTRQAGYLKMVGLGVAGIIAAIIIFRVLK